MEFRLANENDVALILEFIKVLAVYEKMSDWNTYRITGETLAELGKKIEGE